MTKTKGRFETANFLIALDESSDMFGDSGVSLYIKFFPYDSKLISIGRMGILFSSEGALSSVLGGEADSGALVLVSEDSGGVSVIMESVSSTMKF